MSLVCHKQRAINLNLACDVHTCFWDTFLPMFKTMLLRVSGLQGFRVVVKCTALHKYSQTDSYLCRVFK